MFLIPYHKFSIKTSIDSDQIRRTVESICEKPSSKGGSWKDKDRVQPKRFFCHSNTDAGFVLHFWEFSAVFVVEIRGRKNGSALLLTALPHYFYIIIWGALLVLMVFAMVEDGGTFDKGWNVFLLFVVYGFIMWDFTSQLKEAKKVLTAAFQPEGPLGI